MTSEAESPDLVSGGPVLEHPLKIPVDIREIAESFVADFPWLARTDRAAAACEDMSSRLAQRHVDARLLYALGCRTYFPNRSRMYERDPNPDPFLCHTVCRIGDWCICVTRRQFDPHCRHPFIQHRSEFDREWLRTSDTVIVPTDAEIDGLARELAVSR